MINFKQAQENKEKFDKKQLDDFVKCCKNWIEKML